MSRSELLERPRRRFLVTFCGCIGLTLGRSCAVRSSLGNNLTSWATSVLGTSSKSAFCILLSGFSRPELTDIGVETLEELLSLLPV